jgi:hypothetical protein
MGHIYFLMELLSNLYFTLHFPLLNTLFFQFSFSLHAEFLNARNPKSRHRSLLYKAEIHLLCEAENGVSRVVNSTEEKHCLKFPPAYE